MKKLILNKYEGEDILKNEIAESYQRVKAVKFGMLIKQMNQENIQKAVGNMSFSGERALDSQFNIKPQLGNAL